jgi:hypothetical protein
MRATNYTLFSSELKGTGKQIITVQVLNERKMNNTDLFLADLKNQGLLDPSAQLLKIEKYSYRQNHLDQEALKKLGPEAQELFEILKTTHITNLSSYIEKWKTALKLWSEMTAQIPDPYPQVPFLEGGEAKPDGSVSSTNGEAHS